MRSFQGEARKATLDEIIAVAKMLEIEPAAFRAVIAVEAAGSGFDSKGRPKALFERHYFYKHTFSKPDLHKRAVEEGLAYQAWGMKPYPKGSDAVYDEITRACAIDERAALLSTSWGLGQIMGSNFKMAGHESVEDMVDEACKSETGQLKQMGLFIKNAGLIRPLRFKDWAAFAKGYNGPGYAKNAYDTKLADAYTRLSAGA
jgi:hypothetical protein